MPSKTDKQRNFFRAVMAYKKGTLSKDKASKKVRDAAASMSEEQVQDYLTKESADPANPAGQQWLGEMQQLLQDVPNVSKNRRQELQDRIRRQAARIGYLSTISRSPWNKRDSGTLMQNYRGRRPQAVRQGTLPQLDDAVRDRLAAMAAGRRSIPTSIPDFEPEPPAVQAASALPVNPNVIDRIKANKRLKRKLLQ